MLHVEESAASLLIYFSFRTASAGWCCCPFQMQITFVLLHSTEQHSTFTRIEMHITIYVHKFNLAVAESPANWLRRMRSFFKNEILMLLLCVF
jgi:hypothetical protein